MTTRGERPSNITLYETPANFKRTGDYTWDIRTRTLVYSLADHQVLIGLPAKKTIDLTEFGITPPNLARSIVALPELGMMTLTGFWDRLQATKSKTSKTDNIIDFLEVTAPVDDESKRSFFENGGFFTEDLFEALGLGSVTILELINQTNQKTQDSSILDSYVRFRQFAQQLMVRRAIRQIKINERANSNSLAGNLDLPNRLPPNLDHNDRAFIRMFDYLKNFLSLYINQFPQARVNRNWHEDMLRNEVWIIYRTEVNSGVDLIKRYKPPLTKYRYLAVRPDLDVAGGNGVRVSIVDRSKSKAFDHLGTRVENSYTDLRIYTSCPFFNTGFAPESVGWFSSEAVSSS